MEERAKELAQALRDYCEMTVDVSINRETMAEIADLLDPPEYPCNGEIVEFVLDDGDKSIGYATDRGVSIWHNGYANISWSRIKDYRIIREANECVPNPDAWPADCNRIIVFSKPIYSGTVCDTDSEISARNYTRAEAEEIHKELK